MEDLPVGSRASLTVISCSLVGVSIPVILDLSDSLFPVRILRPLTAKHTIIETDLKAYLAEPVSKAFANTISSKIALRPWIGARAYFLSSICHDWSDAKCRQILSNTVTAMEPGYSQILTNDWILPDTGSPLVPALLDIQMLAVLSGMEHTQTQ